MVFNVQFKYRGNHIEDLLDVGLGAIHYAHYNIRTVTQNHIFFPPGPARTPNPSSNFGGKSFSGRVHKTYHFMAKFSHTGAR